MVRKQLNKFFRNARTAVLITLASIGLVLMINGFLVLLPTTLSGVTSIVAGLVIILVMGYWGFGIVGKKS